MKRHTMTPCLPSSHDLSSDANRLRASSTSSRLPPTATGAKGSTTTRQRSSCPCDQSLSAGVLSSCRLQLWSSPTEECAFERLSRLDALYLKVPPMALLTRTSTHTYVHSNTCTCTYKYPYDHTSRRRCRLRRGCRRRRRCRRERRRRRRRRHRRRHRCRCIRRCTCTPTFKSHTQADMHTYMLTCITSVLLMDAHVLQRAGADRCSCGYYQHSPNDVDAWSCLLPCLLGSYSLVNDATPWARGRH